MSNRVSELTQEAENTKFSTKKTKQQHSVDDLLKRLSEYRNVASIRDVRYLETALSYRDQLSAVFLLTGSIGVIKGYVELFQKHHIPVFVHVEKIGGFLTTSKDLNI